MTTAISILETKIKSFMTSMIWIQPESADLYKLYWGEINTDSVYTSLASSAAATFSTKLTKQEITNALTYIEQLDKFFTNQAPAQSDYLLNIEGILYGNDAYTSPGISTAIEDFGVRSVALCTSVLQIFKDAKDMLDIYFDTEISAAIGAVTGENVPWYGFSKSDFAAAMAMIEAFKKLVNNEVSAQADYGATVAKWTSLV